MMFETKESMYSRKLRGLVGVASYQHDSLGYLRSLRGSEEGAYRLTIYITHSPLQLSGVCHVFPESIVLTKSNR